MLSFFQRANGLHIHSSAFKNKQALAGIPKSA
jgi:hypothetical protein